MLTITRGLVFTANHTITDDGETLSDMSGYVVKSQIREKNAIKGVGGNLEYPLVIDVDVTMSGPKDSYMKLSLSRDETMGLPLGDFLVDVVGTKDGVDEFILCKEPIKVVGFVTLPEDIGDVPDFVEQFETALNS